MKFEVGSKKPENFSESWEGQYDVFSHFEYISGIPSVMFMITTLKENGRPNACLHAWSTFSGDRDGFFAIMAGLMQHTHTYKNILRDKEFCINFLDSSYYDSCIKTIEHNNEEDDEFLIGGFTPEPGRTIKPPRIKEAFLSYECTLESFTDLSGSGLNSMIIGRVQHAAIDESFKNIDSICGKKGFMFNIHCPKDAITGEGDKSAVASLKVVKLI